MQNTTAQNVTLRPFAEMVENLFKNMDTAEASLMHVAAGVCGEAVEIQVGMNRLLAMPARHPEINEALDNVVEELGDLRFYIQKGWNIYGWEWDSFVLPAPGAGGSIPAIVAAAGDYLDIAKKSWVYSKELDVVKLYDINVALLAAYRDTLLHFGWTDAFICERNQQKLAKRYPEGVYSDAAAQARADKQERTAGCPCDPAGNDNVQCPDSNGQPACE